MTAEIGKSISKAQDLLRNGDLVAIPTETAAGQVVTASTSVCQQHPERLLLLRQLAEAD